MKDRTSEFFAAVSSSMSQYNLDVQKDTAALLPNTSVATPRGQASEFTQRASAIAREINNTHQKLLKLTKCK
jgi:hypothetical protein